MKFLKGMPGQAIMKFTGHTSERNFLKFQSKNIIDRPNSVIQRGTNREMKKYESEKKCPITVLIHLAQKALEFHLF